MIFSPLDKDVAILTDDGGVLALLVAQDLIKDKTNPDEFLKEVEDLLASVDLSISAINRPEDEECCRMQRNWAFVGTGLNKKIQQLKLLLPHARRFETMQQLFASLANIQTFLLVRRQTLELNGIDVVES